MTGRRMPWAHVAPSMQTSFELARDHRVGQAAAHVLHAIHYLLGLRQVLEDEISTAQIARQIGLWDGEDECPTGTRKTIGRHLGALAKAGAITYNPAPGRGRLGTVGLPDAEPIPGCACTDCKGKGAYSPRPSTQKGGRDTRPSPGKGAHHPHPSQQEGRARDAERARATPRTPSERARAAAPLPRVETPRSLPEGGAASDGPSPSGAVRSGVTPNGAGADPAPPPDDDMPAWMAAIWAAAPADMTQDTWAGDIIDTLGAAPKWFLITIPAWFKEQPPDDLAHACRIIKHNADLHDDVDIRLPKGPK